jgi:hypothetical protein
MVQELIRKVGGGMMAFSSSRSFLLSLFEDNFGPYFPVRAVSVARVLFPDTEPLFITLIDSEGSASARDAQSRGGVWARCFDRISEADW